MDRHGVVNLLRRAAVVIHDKRIRTLGDDTWKWAHAVLVFPEIPCPYCGVNIRSNAVWFFDGRSQYLLGQVRIRSGRYALDPPWHPHMGNNYACTGTAKSWVELFAGVNLNSPIQAPHQILWWIDYYFDHVCNKMKEWHSYWGGRGSCMFPGWVTDYSTERLHS